MYVYVCMYVCTSMYDVCTVHLYMLFVHTSTTCPTYCVVFMSRQLLSDDDPLLAWMRGCSYGLMLLYCCMGLLVTFVLNSLPPLTVVTCRPAPSCTREESHRYRVHAECTSAGTFVKPIARGGFDTFFSHAHSYATKKESIDDGHQPLFVGQYV